MNDYEDVENRLQRYRPVGPPAVLRERVLAGVARPSGPSVARPVVWIPVACSVVLLVGAAWLWSGQSRTAPLSPQTGVTDREQAEFQARWNAQARVDLPVAAAGAKVVIVEFIDWLCPPCDAVDTRYRRIVDRYAASQPGTVSLVVMDLPWDTTCNATVPRTLHPGACQAAIAVRLARNRNRAAEMIAWLSANNDPLRADGGTPPAAMISDEVERRFGVDINNESARLLDEIRHDISIGRTAGVASTPSVFINGVLAADRSGGQLSEPYIDLAIRLELQGAARRR
jgi:protein-disulfide isomerase